MALLYHLKKIDKSRTGILCLRCGTLIVSWSVHDFKECSCGNCNIDGGTSYLKYGWVDKALVQLIDIKPLEVPTKEPRVVFVTDALINITALENALDVCELITVNPKQSIVKNFILDLDADRQYQKANYKFIAYGTNAVKLLKKLNIPFLHLKRKKVDKQIKECYNYIYD
jgi:hypothetical protein